MHPWDGKIWSERKAATADFWKWHEQNPDKRHRFGAAREDGRVFAGYNVNAKNGERWVLPESIDRDAKRSSEWTKKHRALVTQKAKQRYQSDESVRLARLQKRREWFARNKEKARAAIAKWKAQNPERHKLQQLEWRRKNKQRIAARASEYMRQNKAKVNANTARRAARKRNQLHPDLDRKHERGLFMLAAELTRRTGIEHHVDHIVPLCRGGWHHQANLQVLPITANLAKGTDPFWESDLYLTWRDVPTHLWPSELSAEYNARILRVA